MRLNELEIKISIDSNELFKQVHNLCNQFFGPPNSHILQLDEYYDTSNEELKKQDLVIRIRSHENKQTIALKSPRVVLPSGMTHRIELEFLSADGEKVHEQLLKQGLIPVQTSEKERWTFVNEDCEIVLDRLPFIGTFVEIEGPSEEAIFKMVHLLGLSSCQIVRQHYGELMIEKLKALQLPITNIHATFAKEKEFTLTKK